MSEGIQGGKGFKPSSLFSITLTVDKWKQLYRLLSGMPYPEDNPNAILNSIHHQLKKAGL